MKCILPLLVVLLSNSATGDIYDICITPQWEGTQTFYTGTQEGDTPTFIQTTGRISFDANNSRIAAFTSGSQDGRSFNKDFIFLFNKNAVFIIENGQCHKEILNTGFPPLCLPDDFNWTMSRTWYGFPKMDAQLWIFGYDGMKNDLKYSVQLFSETRILVTQQIVGTINNVPFFQDTQTVNATRGIENPDVFNLPSSCQDVVIRGNFSLPMSIYGMFLP